MLMRKLDKTRKFFSRIFYESYQLKLTAEKDQLNLIHFAYICSTRNLKGCMRGK